MEITLIRHLKTPGNQKRQYIGSTDENLAPEEKCRFESENRKKLYPKVEQVISESVILVFLRERHTKNSKMNQSIRHGWILTERLHFPRGKNRPISVRGACRE